jgi:hypothetical protein
MTLVFDTAWFETVAALLDKQYMNKQERKIRINEFNLDTIVQQSSLIFL